MGWDKGRYYTRSRKRNGRVIREYVGGGLIGQLAAHDDALERLKREDEREVLQDEQEQEQLLTDYCAAVNEVLTKTLIAVGYHKHKGQWRRKRGEEKNSNRVG